MSKSTNFAKFEVFSINLQAFAGTDTSYSIELSKTKNSLKCPSQKISRNLKFFSINLQAFAGTDTSYNIVLDRAYYTENVCKNLHTGCPTKHESSKTT